jgi:arginyl-tRNA synthetase
MTTLTIARLEVLLEKLGLKVPIPHFEAADVLNKPLDICRSYYADILISLVNSDPENEKCDPKNAFNSIHSPGDVLIGDLAVVLPRLCHGSKATILGPALMEKVRSSFDNRNVSILCKRLRLMRQISFQKTTLY